MLADALRAAGRGGQKMNRREFIDGLREALAGEIPSAVVEENVRFYNRYIDEETGKAATAGCTTAMGTKPAGEKAAHM